MGQEMNQIEANKNENGQEVIARVGDWHCNWKAHKE